MKSKIINFQHINGNQRVELKERGQVRFFGNDLAKITKHMSVTPKIKNLACCKIDMSNKNNSKLRKLIESNNETLGKGSNYRDSKHLYLLNMDNMKAFFSEGYPGRLQEFKEWYEEVVFPTIKLELIRSSSQWSPPSTNFLLGNVLDAKKYIPIITKALKTASKLYHVYHDLGYPWNEAALKSAPYDKACFF